MTTDHAIPTSAGLPTEDKPGFLDLIYGTLFDPEATFEALAIEGKPIPRSVLLWAIVVVALVSAIGPVGLAVDVGTGDTLLLEVLLHAVMGLLMWLLMALVIGGIAYGFTGKSQLSTFLVLSGLATLPWLFSGPMELLKNGLGGVGELVGGLGAMALWLWSMLLFVVALISTYKMSAERAFMVLLAPTLMMAVGAAWWFGFFINLMALVPKWFQ